MLANDTLLRVTSRAVAMSSVSVDKHVSMTSHEKTLIGRWKKCAYLR